MNYTTIILTAKCIISTEAVRDQYEGFDKENRERDDEEADDNIN